uniref:Uncharacterized protein n=1 Tax=Arundo donax TaxID=35708 RepID=A0A0A8YBG7_ARUDO
MVSKPTSISNKPIFITLNQLYSKC